MQNTVLAIARYSVKLEYKFANVNGRKAVQSNVRKICEDSTLKFRFNSVIILLVNATPVQKDSGYLK